MTDRDKLIKEIKEKTLEFVTGITERINAEELTDHLDTMELRYINADPDRVKLEFDVTFKTESPKY